MDELVQFVKEHARSIAGGLVALATWFGAAFADGDIDNGEWAVLPIAVLGGMGIVQYVKDSASEEQLQALDAWKHDQPGSTPEAAPLGE